MKDSVIKKVVFRTQFFDDSDRGYTCISEICQLDQGIMLTPENLGKILEAAMQGEEIGAEDKAKLSRFELDYFFNVDLTAHFVVRREADKDYHMAICKKLYDLCYTPEDYGSRSITVEMPAKTVRIQ